MNLYKLCSLYFQKIFQFDLEAMQVYKENITVAANYKCFETSLIGRHSLIPFKNSSYFIQLDIFPVCHVPVKLLTEPMVGKLVIVIRLLNVMVSCKFQNI